MGSIRNDGATRPDHGRELRLQPRDGCARAGRRGGLASGGGWGRSACLCERVGLRRDRYAGRRHARGPQPVRFGDHRRGGGRRPGPLRGRGWRLGGSTAALVEDVRWKGRWRVGWAGVRWCWTWRPKHTGAPTAGRQGRIMQVSRYLGSLAFASHTVHVDGGPEVVLKPDEVRMLDG